MRCGGTTTVVLRALSIALAVALLCPAGAGAQQAQSNRATNEPGQIERRLETPSQPIAPSAPVVAPPSLPVPSIEGPTRAVTLVAVELIGATVFTPEQLADAYEPWLGKQISITEIEQILATITDTYRRVGYALSYAIAPPQTLDFGILQIRVVEGYIAKVTFAGAAPGGESLLAAYADKITSERPVTLATIERYSLLLSDAPGVVVRPSIRSLEDIGAHELILTLDKNPVQAGAGLDNRGTHAVGPLQAYGVASFNSVFGGLERTSVTLSTVPDNSRELRYGEVNHEEFLGSEGTRGFVSVSHSSLDTYTDITHIKKDGESTRGSIGAKHPLIRARAQNLWVSGRFDVINSSQSQEGDSFDDRLRVMRAGTQYFVSDEWAGDNLASVEFSQGFDALGASHDGGPNLSRAGGRTDFRKFTFELGRQQSFGRNYSALIQGIAQKSGHTLLSGEEIALGGKRFGRAFDPGEVSGRDGAAASLELRLHDSTGWHFLTSYQLYVFGDVGAVWNSDRPRDAVSSTGAGTRIEFVPGFTGNLELAVPVNRGVFAENERRAPRVFFAVNASF